MPRFFVSKMFLVPSFVALVLSFAMDAEAAMHHVRLEQQMNMTGQLPGVLRTLNATPGLPQLTTADFKEVENRVLANYRFATYLQLSQGVPVKGAMIRTWESNADGHLVLLEANVEDPGPTLAARASNMKRYGFFAASLPALMTKANSLAIAQSRILKAGNDRHITKVSSSDQWNGADLQRVIKVTGRRGVHTIVYSHLTGKVVSQSYQGFPEADVQALVYPIYEETEKTHVIQTRVPVTLKNINSYRHDFTGDPLAPLKTRHYYDSMNNDFLASTPDGQAQGYWSMASLKSLIRSLIANLPTVPNDYSNGGLYLEGKYATINIYPNATQFKGITVPLRPSENVLFDSKPAMNNGQPDYDTSILSSYKGQTLADPQAALNRPARRLPNHDPASYINDGFDEVQVYYAINTLVEALQSMGFTDPELSTRPFNAFLFNSDVEYKDNAFYTDDTINFNTYSPDAINAARDNATIWHELGHGIMDRLMGDRIQLADTGGLSEGMADFVAQLIIFYVTDGKPFDGMNDFRIINSTGFNMTNEAHDDGEAYGGAMRDFLAAVFAKEGHQGLVKVADITMDAMRLARNHPALTANDWFETILFADHLGHAGLRAPDEMHALIVQSLAKRNFRFDRGQTAKLNLLADGKPVEAGLPGSRYKPIVEHLTASTTASHTLDVSIAGSDKYSFKYPVTIEMDFNGGPLQGAVKWDGEAAGPKKFVLNSEADKATLTVKALPGCDFVNREDGSCSDFVYVKVFNNGETMPVAKKRFYMQIYTQ